MNMLPFILACLVFLVIGGLLTVWPTQVRDFIMDACVQARWGFWIGREIILRRVRRPSYLYELRIIGIVCIFAAAICAWIIFGEKKPLP
jgi:membrane protein required for beta-lactamase induction